MHRVPGEPPRPSRLGPWLALCSAWLAFELPTALSPDRLDLGQIRLTGEILLTFTLYASSFRLPRGGRALRWALAGLVSVLAIVRVDRTIFFVLSRSEPLLYDQLFLLRHLLVLFRDLSGSPAPLVVLGTLVVCALCARGVRALLRRAAPLFEGPRRREAARVGAALWVFALLASALGPRPPATPWVRWMTPDLARNAAESVRLYRSVRSEIAASPYRAYDRIRLARRPDVYLFFVESYGKLFAENPELRPIWTAELGALRERLASAGWSSASAYSTAPVSGGRSWLAVGSILMGSTIRYEAVFQQLLSAKEHAPTLVDFFERQGYETVQLAPSDRPRPGLADSNRYGYDKYVRYPDLDYRGPEVGWGLVPDQFSLGRAEELVLAKVDRPLFFHFHMVSSHAPWSVVPFYVSDWRSLNEAQGGRPRDVSSSLFGKSLARFTHGSDKEPYMGDLTATFRQGYARSVLYDLRVIEEFLKRRTGDALVIVMGDHQPPVVAPETVSFDVPVHLFARDPKLLEEFRAQGFTDGLVLGAEQGPAVEHAGLFSLVVRALARASGTTEPAYLKHGVKLGS